MEEKNLKFDADITFETEKLESIHCEVVFPKTQDEKVLILARFNTIDSPVPKIPFIFALNATISDLKGNPLIYISASKVYKLEISTSYYDTNRSVSILRAEPVDLKICKRILQADSQKKSFHFWLTQSILLAPAYYPELHHNGNITINTFDTKRFEVLNGLQFNFVNYYIHYDDPKRKNVRSSRSILAAEFTGVTGQDLGEATLPNIEKFLKLVSFAERRRIVCYGYRGISDGEITDFYRGDIFVPEEDFDHLLSETLIDKRDFQEFVSQVSPIAENCVFREHLFDAIGKIAYRESSTLESEYLSYYSALENLVNGYRDASSFHYILENDSWKKFSKDLKDFIKTHDFFKAEKDQESNEVRSRNENRQLMYEKILELNRVSFGTVFKSFCNDYGVDLRDLWSLGGGEVSTSLSKIRNRLIHGGRFEREEYEAVIYARSHLKWTLERCILRVLGWNVERSRVCSTFLEPCVGYSEWREKLNLLKNG
ncbi:MULTISPECIES: hypothetical protein [Leptolyngbya]|uniref:hypothetical protein n=1 Tax=Leptolyngbya TaxID=47251 RepID=UPI00168978BB|nr:hypothetical protein [Leptolyngbya sp. FACHB-1624]MBD1857691.1 hypothetical protein [Leptolyngbya sp. FACHB-1624]